MAQQESLQQNLALSSVLQPGFVVQAQQGSLLRTSGSAPQNGVLQMRGVAHAQQGSHHPSLASDSVLQPIGVAEVQQGSLHPSLTFGLSVATSWCASC